MQLDVLHEETTTFKWPIPLSRTMAVPAERLWETITTPEILERSHPFVDKNPAERWSGVGSRDTIYYHSGLTLDRHITHWIEGVGYDLDATDQQGRTSHVIWRIDDVDGARSTLTIAIMPYLFQRAPRPLRWLPHHLYLRPMIRRYLDSVLKGFEVYITTGQTVRRNQFGSHYVFSPRIKRGKDAG